MGQPARSFLWLFLFVSMTPLCFYICFWCWLIFKLRPKFNIRLRKLQKPVVVVLGGNKPQALHISRLFSANGFEIVVCHTESFLFTCSAWSVHCKKFHKVPNPISQPDSYITKVCSVVESHKASILIPTERNHAAQDVQIIKQLGDSVISMGFDAASFQELDDKITFFEGLQKRGIPCSEHYVITEPSQVRDVVNASTKAYVLKPAYKSPAITIPKDITVPANGQALNAFLESRPIGLSLPFLIEPVMESPVFSTCSLVVNRTVVAHTCMVRLPGSQIIRYQENLETDRWVQHFAENYLKVLTGWMSVDFMRSSHDGHWYPIKCQPRITFQFLLYLESDMVIKEFLQQLHSQNHTEEAEGIMVTPKTRRKLPIKPKCKELHWLFSELYQGLTCRKTPWAICKRVAGFIYGHEALFRFNDPLPFFVYNCLYLPSLIVKNVLCERKKWTNVEFCLGILK